MSSEVGEIYVYIYCSGLLLGCILHGRVVNGHIYTILILGVQRSLTVLRPSQAFHDVIWECRILFAVFPTVAYSTCAQAGSSRRGIIDARRRHQWLVSLRDFRCKGISRCGRCPASIDQYAEEGKKEPNFFHPPKLDDPPPTSELMAPLYHSLLLQSPSLRNCGL